MEKAALTRMVVFFGGLVLLAGAEALWPRRKRVQARINRWFSNIGLVVVSNFLVRVLLPLPAVAFAALMEEKQIGLLHQWAPLSQLPGWAKLILAIVALDFIIYLQHVMFHTLPVLWRLHMVHHADRDIDVTTGIRFHPLEILVSIGIKFASIALIGPTAFAALVFEIILNATAMFNHSNLKLPLGLDRVLRWLVVTPDMHRVHHSVIPRETDSNFGFNLPIWDRLCGTYRAQPEEGHTGMTIGLKEYQSPDPQRMRWILVAPFFKNKKAFRAT